MMNAYLDGSHKAISPPQRALSFSQSGFATRAFLLEFPPIAIMSLRVSSPSLYNVSGIHEANVKREVD